MDSSLKMEPCAILNVEYGTGEPLNFDLKTTLHVEYGPIRYEVSFLNLYLKAAINLIIIALAIARYRFLTFDKDVHIGHKSLIVIKLFQYGKLCSI